MKSPLSCLLVVNSEDDMRLVLRQLRRSDYDVTWERIETDAGMQAALARQPWDLVLADYKLPHFSSLAALKLLRARGLDLPFIIVSDTISLAQASAAMRAGAHDYFMKNRLARLVPAVKRELREAAQRHARRRAEEARRVERIALEAAANAIVITDRTGRIEWTNPALTVLTGYSSAEAIGRNPRELFKSGRHDQEFYRCMMSTILGGDVWRGEVINRRKDGSEYTEEMTITPVRSQPGDITHFIAIKQDVTERAQTAVRIREQAALLDQANDAIYLRTMDGTVCYWNAGAERLYGWTAAEANGRKLSELNLSETDQPAQNEATLRQTGGWTGESQQTARDGRKLIVFSRLSLTRNAKGQPVAVIAFNTDITERKEIESRFLHTQRLENLGALASGLAHDLNNVLAPILMTTAILKDRVTTDADRKLVAIMEASAQRGSGVVRQVLAFARGVKGERVPVQLRHLVREMADIATETFPPAITTQMDVAKHIWPVRADATQLHQVLMNLCINARDAMPHGGRISLTADNLELDEAFAAINPGAKPGPHVCIKVSDTGVGIAPEHRERIFEPFFTTKDHGKGTGLGLATWDPLESTCRHASLSIL